MPNNPTRLECYDRIRVLATERVLMYYQSHPELLQHERIQQDLKDSLDGLKSIFAILDEYIISKKPDGVV